MGRYTKGEAVYSPGNRYIGSVPQIDLPEDPGWGAVRALNPKTGEKAWDFKLHTKPGAGVLSTAGKLVFGGNDEGYFFALDADTGKDLWRVNTGGMVRAGPISFLSKSKQVVAIAAGSAIFTFELRQ
jgi:alcohol dehydrogenase (cytochrome c)